MKKSKPFHKRPDKLQGDELQGLLVAVYGATGELEDEHGNVIRCHLRKNIEPVITGDIVLWRPEQDGAGIVVGHLPRKSVLARPENKSKTKLVAANVDAMLIVTAPAMISEHLLDRYIVAAENLNIQIVIVLNKIDLLDDHTREEINARLEPYRNLGYHIIFSSTVTQDGLSELETFLKNKNSILVGSSGVGKSSIIASFVKSDLIRVGETSTQGLGKHTTTMTRLYHLPQEGNLIDSPGVREFGLWHMTQEEILRGFIDFKPFLNQCRFRDCKHLKEPNCALVNAVEAGKISVKRFQSYQEMLRDD